MLALKALGIWAAYVALFLVLGYVAHNVWNTPTWLHMYIGYIVGAAGSVHAIYYYTTRSGW